MRDQATKSTRKGPSSGRVGPHSVLHEYAVPDDGDPDNLTDVLKANPLKVITRPCSSGRSPLRP